MTDSVLVRGIEFGCGQTQTCDVEQRVITEPARATRSLRDFTVPARIDDDRFYIVRRAERDHYTGVVRAPLLSVREAPQQLCVVALIARTVTSEACRPHAWCAVERLYAQSRVIGERRSSGTRCRMTRFREGVLDKRCVRFVGGVNPQLTLRHDVPRRSIQHGRDFAQLCSVAGRQDKAPAHSSRACFCADINERIPPLASCSMDSICLTENGAPSAVP